MHPVTRRRFLQWTGMSAAGALLGDDSVVDVADLLSRAAPGGGDPALVVVTLYGGNDGLNTVVPATDPAYQDLRPDLAYRPEDVLDLGENLGLNPGMPRMHALWTSGRMRIVRGAGYPAPDHSHFRSMAIWQTANPATSVPTGWLGRWLDTADADPLTAVSLETTAPPFLAGARRTGSTVRPGGVPLPPDANGRAYALLGRPDPADSPSEARAAASVTDLYTVGAAVNRALAGGGESRQLGAQLTAIAALVNAGVPTRVYSASLGGFDTHADERSSQQRLLTELDTAVGTFVDAVADAPRPVYVLVYSEFGRRVHANASQGTDHGTAGPVFLLGAGVRGGFHGAQPSLTDLDAGDLRYGVDFRDVYASVLEEILGSDPAPVLDGWAGRVPLLA